MINGSDVVKVSRSRAIEIVFVTLFALMGAVAAHRSNVLPISDPAPWTDPALAASRGVATARQDLKDGLRKVALFGLITNHEPTASKLRGFGYELQSGGCLIGGSQYDYWRAYNREIIEAGRAQHGDRFVAVFRHVHTGT